VLLEEGGLITTTDECLAQIRCYTAQNQVVSGRFGFFQNFLNWSCLPPPDIVRIFGVSLCTIAKLVWNVKNV